MLLPPTERGSLAYGGLTLPHPLYQFQAEGVKFLLHTQPGALLADDMGLGKTVQAIVAMRMLARLGEMRRGLVVAPKSVITSWRRHLSEWAPELRAEPIQGSAWHRWGLWRQFQRGEFDVGIITYDSLRNDVLDVNDASVTVPPVDILVADEIQNIKNPGTQRARAMRSVQTARRWGLTGTPLENRVGEMAAILRFLDRAVPRGITEPSDLRKYAKPRMMRRRKEQVLDDLPDLVSHIEYVELLEGQRKAYRRAEQDGINELDGKPRSIANVLTLITRLKQICNSSNGESAKLEWLQDYVAEAREEDDKVLIFTQYLESLDEIEQSLSIHSPLKYYGALTGQRREQAEEVFKNDPAHRVMILQVRAGGTGLNLQSGNRVVHFDSWWNPAVQSQATARAHRLGQSKDVFETTLVSVDTIEERIQELLESKRRLFEEVVDELSDDGVAKTLTVDELYRLFELPSVAEA